MPKTKEEYKAYMKEYMLRKYHRIRGEILERLGGKCVKCGSQTDLELDHIDRTTKVMSIAKIWSYAKDKLEAEIVKCQLLCQPCHENKSVTDLGFEHNKGIHGTAGNYKKHGCRCEECTKANLEYMRSGYARYNKTRRDKRRQAKLGQQGP